MNHRFEVLLRAAHLHERHTAPTRMAHEPAALLGRPLAELLDLCVAGVPTQHHHPVLLPGTVQLVHAGEAIVDSMIVEHRNTSNELGRWRMLLCIPLAMNASTFRTGHYGNRVLL